MPGGKLVVITGATRGPVARWWRIHQARLHRAGVRRSGKTIDQLRKTHGVPMTLSGGRGVGHGGEVVGQPGAGIAWRAGPDREQRRRHQRQRAVVEIEARNSMR